MESNDYNTNNKEHNKYMYIHHSYYFFTKNNGLKCQQYTLSLSYDQ